MFVKIKKKPKGFSKVTILYNKYNGELFVKKGSRYAKLKELV